MPSPPRTFQSIIQHGSRYATLITTDDPTGDSQDNTFLEYSRKEVAEIVDSVFIDPHEARRLNMEEKSIKLVPFTCDLLQCTRIDD